MIDLFSHCPSVLSVKDIDPNSSWTLNKQILGSVSTLTWTLPLFPKSKMPMVFPAFKGSFLCFWEQWLKVQPTYATLFFLHPNDLERKALWPLFKQALGQGIVFGLLLDPYPLGYSSLWTKQLYRAQWFWNTQLCYPLKVAAQFGPFWDKLWAQTLNAFDLNIGFSPHLLKYRQQGSLLLAPVLDHAHPMHASLIRVWTSAHRVCSWLMPHF